MSDIGIERSLTKLEVELIPDEIAIELEINPAMYRGPAGKAPRIGEDDCWEVYDNEREEWIRTGVFARGGISDYDQLPNRPRINGIELVGDKSALELGLENSISNSDIEALFVD